MAAQGQPAQMVEVVQTLALVELTASTLATVEGVNTVKVMTIKEQTAAWVTVPREGPLALISGTVQRLPTKGKAGTGRGLAWGTSKEI